MIIRYAEEKNFIELRQFYDGMCKVLSGKDFLPEGDKGGFPPDEMIKDAIKERNQFIGIEDGRIVAAYIMNHDRDEAYHAVKWLIDANDNETVVLHALRVLPEYGGRGYSKQLVKHAIDTARERNIKSIRLDCIEGNDIPQKMYMSFGFKYGIPRDSDMVQDVRFLPNPYYDLELRDKTGNDKEVQDYVMNCKEGPEFLDKFMDLVGFLVPNYIKEGKNQLVISVGCTGGKHRSVTIANAVYERLQKSKYTVRIVHRDIAKDSIVKKM